MRRKRKSKDKPKKIHWTTKVGGHIGKGLNKAFANKKVVFIVITILLVLLFVFVVPLKNNIVSVVILTALFITYFVLQYLEKKK